jgi:hypothetical protein
VDAGVHRAHPAFAAVDTAAEGTGVARDGAFGSGRGNASGAGSARDDWKAAVLAVPTGASSTGGVSVESGCRVRSVPSAGQARYSTG